MTKVDDPRRLFESDDAPTELRDWLTRAHTDGISDVAAARLVRAVEQRMSGAEHAPTQVATWRRVANHSRLAKVLCVAAIAGLAGGLWRSQHRDTPTRTEARGAQITSALQPAAVMREAPSAVPATPRQTKEAVADEPVTPSTNTGVHTREATGASAAPRVDLPSNKSAVTPLAAAENGGRLADTPVGTDEFQLLRAARRAAATEPAKALQLTDEHLRQFPGGLLAQEREAIAVESLVNLGRAAAATSRGNGFLARYPNSPYRTRIETALRRISAPQR